MVVHHQQMVFTTDSDVEHFEPWMSHQRYIGALGSSTALLVMRDLEAIPLFTTGSILALDNDYTNGQWVGPHCPSCDMDMFFNGLHEKSSA